MTTSGWPYVIEIVWRSPSEGGRRTGPPTGPDYFPTMVPWRESYDGQTFLPNNQSHFSVVLKFESTHIGDKVQRAFARPLAEDVASEFMVANSKLLIMEGPRVVGEARVVSTVDG